MDTFHLLLSLRSFVLVGFTVPTCYTGWSLRILGIRTVLVHGWVVRSLFFLFHGVHNGP